MTAGAQTDLAGVSQPVETVSPDVRLENVVKNYPRTLVIPEALYRLGEVYAGDGRAQEAQESFRRVATEFSYTEWGRRAAQRLKATATR